MAIENLISEIDAEIVRLTQVRNLLAGTASATKRRGRTAGMSNVATIAPATKPSKRVMSPEARERIAAAQRKRWAKQKKAVAAKAPAKAAKRSSAKKAATKAPKSVAAEKTE